VYGFLPNHFLFGKTVMLPAGRGQFYSLSFFQKLSSSLNGNGAGVRENVMVTIIFLPEHGAEL
jgi:hypothetical protein